MNKKLLLTPIVALILSACDAVSERDCGVFDHPDLELWQPDLLQASVSFMSEEGIGIDFTRSPVTFNEPFLGSDGSSNDEDVVCELTASFRYEAADSSLAITSVYQQFERSLLDSADETLAVEHIIEAPAGTILEGSFLTDITQVTDDDARSVFITSRVLYLDTDLVGFEIGGQSFLDVVRINAPGFVFIEQAVDEDDDSEDAETEIISIATGVVPDTGDALPASDAVRQILIGRNAGLIALIDDEGNEFVRLAAP